MIKNGIRRAAFVGVILTLTPSVFSAVGDGRILQVVVETQKLIDNGEIHKAQDAFDELQADFPKDLRPDLDLYIKGELYYANGKYTKAAKSFEKMLTEHPRSSLKDAALEREFTIGKAYLDGRKKTVFGFIHLSGAPEGIRIMEKITDRVGLDSTMGRDASLAVANNYEERELYEEAYLKWWEISVHWNEGPVGKEALLGMGRTKIADYNKHPEQKRHLYDASGLSTAKSCYSRFKLLYPVDARQINVDKILEEIDEQLAYKQLSIGQYYQSTGHKKAANLYYRMVVNDWPDTQAAKTAKDLLADNPELESDLQTSPEK
ncbi:MAG: outer membrane protein assembly factor BamD [Sedimentisphaerales bacterium]|nr:outer membrane protein assembly factor BamD [Sedimentisphaerales bacterium]